MPWQDRYQQGHYRGVPFYTKTDRSKFGRRNIIFESPELDGASSQSIGVAARRFDMTVYFIGDEYDIDLRAFIDVVENNAQGFLDHPHYGRHLVALEDGIEVEHSTDNGGMCTVTFTAVEVGDYVLPRQGLSQADAAQYAANRALEALGEDFEDNLDVTERANFVREAAEATSTSLLEDITEMAAQVDQILDVPGQYVGKFERLALDVATYMNSPSDFFDDVESLVGRVLGSVALVEGATERLLGLVGIGVGDDLNTTVIVDTPNRNAQSENTKHLRAMAKGTMVLHIMKASIVAGEQVISEDTDNADTIDARNSTGFESVEQAAKMKEATQAIVDSIITNDAPGDNAMAALVLAQAAFSDYLDVVTGRRVGTLNLGETAPSVVVSQDYYGHARNGQDIVDRNAVAHPLFVPGGVDLTVVSDA